MKLVALLLVVISSPAWAVEKGDFAQFDLVKKDSKGGEEKIGSHRAEIAETNEGGVVLRMKSVIGNEESEKFYWIREAILPTESSITGVLEECTQNGGERVTTNWLGKDYDTCKILEERDTYVLETYNARLPVFAYGKKVRIYNHGTTIEQRLTSFKGVLNP